MLCLTSGSLTGGGPPGPSCGRAYTQGWGVVVVVEGEGAHVDTEQLIIYAQTTPLSLTQWEMMRFGE